MSYSYTVSSTQTFTVTNARHMSAKVATDLKRIQRLYVGGPSDLDIANYETELTELLKAGCLGAVTYGFWRNGEWIEPTLRYTAQDLAGMSADDDPGKIRASANVSGATFYSYLTYSSAWSHLSESEKDAFKKAIMHLANTPS